MSKEKTVFEFNAETGEEIIRPMTEQELAQIELDALKQAELDAAEAEKKAAKLALYERLGISEEEAQLLLS